jgi:hypothetical protein
VPTRSSESCVVFIADFELAIVDLFRVAGVRCVMLCVCVRAGVVSVLLLLLSCQWCGVVCLCFCLSGWWCVPSAGRWWVRACVGNLCVSGCACARVYGQVGAGAHTPEAEDAHPRGRSRSQRPAVERRGW